MVNLLGPVIREYVVSEYMNNINIPTTRSLSAVLTGDNVYREETYLVLFYVELQITHKSRNVPIFLF